MKTSQKKIKSKPKSTSKVRLTDSLFVVTAQRAMRKAYRFALKENARYGLPLIVQRSSSKTLQRKKR